MKLTRSICLLFVISLPVVGLVQTGVPALPEIPKALQENVRASLIAKRQPLAEQKLVLIDEGNSINQRCAKVEKGSQQHQDCLAQLARFNAGVQTLRSKVDQLADEIDLAIDAEIALLGSRDKELTAALDRDAEAIRNLGFARRAEDFAEWEKLGADAKAQFENEVIDAATDQIAGKISDHLLESFSHFNAAKAGRWIKLLEKVEPPPTELIRLIRKVGDIPDKARAIEDAAKIVQGIERLKQASAAQSREDMLLLGMDLICDVVPPPGDASCNAFKTIGKLTVASLYNNVARRVAINEVERLTTMTEGQLLALAKINELMVKHVKERNEVRAKLKQLE
jgi:hypothetical protein